MEIQISSVHAVSLLVSVGNPLLSEGDEALSSYSFAIRKVEARTE